MIVFCHVTSLSTVPNLPMFPPLYLSNPDWLNILGFPQSGDRQFRHLFGDPDDAMDIKSTGIGGGQSLWMTGHILGMNQMKIQNSSYFDAKTQGYGLRWKLNGSDFLHIWSSKFLGFGPCEAGETKGNRAIELGTIGLREIRWIFLRWMGDLSLQDPTLQKTKRQSTW
jgi:hypothetical protein